MAQQQQPRRQRSICALLPVFPLLALLAAQWPAAFVAGLRPAAAAQRGARLELLGAAAAKKAAAAPKKKAAAAADVKALSETQRIEKIAEELGMPAKEVKKVVDAYWGFIEEDLKGAKESKVAGLLSLRVEHKPATEGGMKKLGFRDEPVMVAAKPASTKLKANVLKKLKDAVGV